MDERALKKLQEIITILTKMKKENNPNSQGFNDRMIVAKDIYLRNKKNKEFVKSLTSSINDSNEEIFELVISTTE